MFRKIAVLLAAVLMVFMSSVPASASPQEDIITKVNAVRAQNGLPAVKSNTGLAQVAAYWSQKMSETDTLSHNPQAGTQIPKGWKMWGENVGYSVGSADNASVIFEGWMNSPGHRANILKPEFTDLGVGVVVSANGTMWATQNFAQYATASSAPAPVTPSPAPATPAPTPAPAAPAPAAPTETKAQKQEREGKEKAAQEQAKKDAAANTPSTLAPAAPSTPVAPRPSSPATPAEVAGEIEPSPSPTPSTSKPSPSPSPSKQSTARSTAPSTVDPDDNDNMGWLMAGLGVIALASGIGAYVVYKKSKPPTGV